MKHKIIDWKKMNDDATRALERVGLKLEPNMIVGKLSVAQQQLVEIAKALSLNLRLLIMDEPTSSLTDAETHNLFKIIESLKKKGITIIYISHRMDEIFSICDSYTVLRDGSFVSSGLIAETSLDKIIKDMVGREMSQMFPPHKTKIGEVILSANNISNGAEVKDVSFELKQGEILGFSGLVGAGRTETFKALFGYDNRYKGRIKIRGKEVRIKSPRDAINHGIGYVPEDRRREGLVVSLPVIDNIVMANLDRAMTKGFYSNRKASYISKEYIDSFMIKIARLSQRAQFLSGGNQQKVVLSKWLNCDSEILILDEPTRGIDVNAKREIYSMIVDLIERGKSIILISSEMDEIIGLCDEVYVMYEGKVTAKLQKEDLNQEKIMFYATGGEKK
jgi:ABC-type sugar transport system ATPase subunit